MASTRVKTSLGGATSKTYSSTPGSKDVKSKMVKNAVGLVPSSTTKAAPKALASLRKNAQGGSANSVASTAKVKGSVVATIPVGSKKLPATSLVPKGGVLGSKKGGQDTVPTDYYSKRYNNYDNHDTRKNGEASESSTEEDLNGNGNMDMIHNGEVNSAVVNLEMQGPPAVPQEDLNTKMKRFLSAQLKSSSTPNLGVSTGPSGRPPIVRPTAAPLKTQPLPEPSTSSTDTQPPLPTTCEPNCSGMHFCLKLPAGLTLQPVMNGQCGQATVAIRPISDHGFVSSKAQAQSQGSPTFFNSVIGDLMSIRSMALNSGICTVDDSQAMAKVEGLIMRVLAYKDAEQDVPKLMQP